MEKFRSGNIIKDRYGNILIFIEYFTNNDGKRLFKWVSFDSQGCSGISPVKTEEYTKDCGCSFNNWVDEDTTAPLDDCERCGGSGEYISKRYGEDEYKVLASNCKDYLNKLLKGALNKLK